MNNDNVKLLSKIYEKFNRIEEIFLNLQDNNIESLAI